MKNTLKREIYCCRSHQQT